MANGRGGKRAGAGRKPKAEEKELIGRLSPMEDLAHEKLKAALGNGDKWAVEMFFSYMYGKPKQSVDVTTKGQPINSYADWTDEQIEDEYNRLKDEA